MTRTLRTALLAGLALAAAVPALAEKNWILPNATVFSGAEGWVSVDAAASGDLFFADHRPGNLDQIKVVAPDGLPGKIVNGTTMRRRTVFDVQLDKQGTWRIGTQSANVMGSYKVNGEERRIGGRGGPPPGAGGLGGPGQGGPGGPGGEGGFAGRGPGGGANGPGGQGGPGGGGRPGGFGGGVSVADIPADATDVKITQAEGRYDVFVTLGAPTRSVLATTGKGLEFDPITHPDELVLGEPARFRFLLDGKPLAGLHVTLVAGGTRYRNSEEAMELVTGADGVATVKWPGAGLYWMGATWSDTKPTIPRATDRRLSYNATLEVLTP